MHVGMSDGIYFEVGGTSTNLGVVRAGRPIVTYANVGGHETYVSSLDVHVLGIGGGSLIRIGGGAVREVGPRSAHIAGLRYACFAPAEHIPECQGRLLRAEARGRRRLRGDRDRTRRSLCLDDDLCRQRRRPDDPEMHCYAPRGSRACGIRAARRLLGKEVVALASQVLSAAVARWRPSFEHLIKDHQLDEDQQLLVGMGGGIGALLPSVAERVGLGSSSQRMPRSFPRSGQRWRWFGKSVERANPDPSSEDIAASSRRNAGSDRPAGGGSEDGRYFGGNRPPDRPDSRDRDRRRGAPQRRIDADLSTSRRPGRIAARSLHRPEDEIELPPKRRRVRLHPRNRDRDIRCGSSIGMADAPATQPCGRSARRRSRDGSKPSSR